MSEISLAMTQFTPLRAEYGQGLFVRSVVIASPEPGQVRLAMEDTGHAFHLAMSHQNGVITAVDATWIRQPMSSCSGAPQALQAMVGARLSDQVFDLAQHTDSRQQCTHQFDMLCLAAVHAHQQREDRRYDIVVPDNPNGPVTATLSCNGEQKLQWQLEEYVRVVQPAAMRGVGTLKGFTSWVQTHVPPAERELYFMMQRALFVARVQLVDVEVMIDQEAYKSGPPPSSCYGSQPERYEHAKRMDCMRRFDASTQWDTLTFFPHPLSRRPHN